MEGLGVGFDRLLDADLMRPESSRWREAAMRPRFTTAIVCLAFTACATSPQRGQPTSAFDLECKAQTLGNEDLVFRVVPAEGGDVIVVTMNSVPLVDYETHTYVNALLWTNGTTRYVVDRFTGVLSTRPPGDTYQCSKRGITTF